MSEVELLTEDSSSDEVGVLFSELADAVRSDQAFSMNESGSRKGRGMSDVEACMLALDSLLGCNLVEKALEICEKGRRSIVRYKTASGRSSFRVKGSTGVYSVYGGYCTCPNFSIRISSGVAYCKHLLAVRFAEALDALETTEVDDESFDQYVTGG